MKIPKPSSPAHYIGLTLCIVAIGLGTLVWIEGPAHGLSRETQIIVELSLFSGLLVLLMFVKYFEAVLLWMASMRAAMRQTKPDQDNPQQDDDAQASNPIMALRERLKDQYGPRWRHHIRILMLTGDPADITAIAPDIAEHGHSLTGNTLLIHAKETGGQFDTAWLQQVCRLRRCPADALVAVVREEGCLQALDAERIGPSLYRLTQALRWSAPAYLLAITDFGNAASSQGEAIGLTWSNPRLHADNIDTSLLALSDTLANVGITRLTRHPPDQYAARLSRYISEQPSALSALVAQIGQSRLWPQATYGLLFAPLDKKGTAQPAPHHALWQTIAQHSRQLHGRRVGFSLSATAAWATAALASLWLVGTMLSGFTNRATIQAVADTLQPLSAEPDRTRAALALDSLQKHIDTLEVHQQRGAPWVARFGLNHDHALLAAIWPGYERAAGRVLIGPIRLKLEDRLHQLASLSDAEIAGAGDVQVKTAYDTLKAYLMLAKPERADAAFLTPQWIGTAEPARPYKSSLGPGQWEDLRQRLIAFHASHLVRHASSAASPAIVPDGALVATTRQTIIGVRGIQNSTDAVYQHILDDTAPKYAPLTLPTLLGDTSSKGLFSTTASLPGVYTRAAWDERIARAIDDASAQHNAGGDWVLADAPGQAKSDAALKAELRQRYFDDYARAWQAFLNSLRWQPEATLAGTVDQLTLLADPQRSPLTALINAVVYQAGAGASAQSLSDTLVAKAQQLIGSEQDPSKMQPPPAAPLATAFGPLLQLAGSSPGTGTQKPSAPTTDLSLPRFLERVTAMRLKLQQIMMAADPDAMSRTAAQAVLQGRSSDIADSRDYASRVAASLGQQWASLGELFEQPLAQTWQVVLQPAALSLNDTWRNAIVADWNRAFGGRYPFADADNDASLPEMARFMRPEGGVVTQFVAVQLAGVVERQGDHWVAAPGAAEGGLVVDPAFLTALNRLMRVSTVLFPGGDARVRYELRPVPTPGVTEMRLLLGGHELHYFNQKEAWQPFLWPGDALENRSRLAWQTEQGGLRSAYDAQGRFGLIRLLEHATVKQQDNARYLLTWTPDQSLGLPLQVQLRAEAGAGPLAALALRGFTLPSRIFMTGKPMRGQPAAQNGPAQPASPEVPQRGMARAAEEA